VGKLEIEEHETRQWINFAVGIPPRPLQIIELLLSVLSYLKRSEKACGD